MMKRKMEWDECIRDCHIVYMIIGIYGIMKSNVEKRREAVQKVMSKCHSIDLVTDYVVKKVRKLKKQIDFSQWKLSNPLGVVYHKDCSFVVDLAQRQCSCGRYQEYGYPCKHAYAFILLTSNDFYNSMTNWVHPYYLVSTVSKTCEYMMPNSPEISTEAVEAFSKDFGEETCPAVEYPTVENTSTQHIHSVVDVPAIQQKKNTHLASQGRKGRKRKSGENAERASKTPKKKECKPVPQAVVKKTQKLPKSKKVNERDLWIGVDDEFVFEEEEERVEEERAEDECVYAELSEDTPLSQPEIHILNKKRLQKRRHGEGDQQKSKQSPSQGSRYRYLK